jgi:hypothetical protein
MKIKLEAQGSTQTGGGSIAQIGAAKRITGTAAGRAVSGSGPLTDISQRGLHRVRLLVQYHAQQRAMDFETPVVLNRPQVAKLVHEMAHA